MTAPRKYPVEPPSRGKSAAALALVALLAAVPFIVKRGCSFSAKFDPVNARTNNGAIQVHPPLTR
jgi:hypothetical protein